MKKEDDEMNIYFKEQIAATLVMEVTDETEVIPQHMHDMRKVTTMLHHPCISEKPTDDISRENKIQSSKQNKNTTVTENRDVQDYHSVHRSLQI